MKNSFILLIEIIILTLLVYVKYINEGFSSVISQHISISALINFIIFVIFVDFIRRILNYSYTKRKSRFSGQKDNFQFGINNIAKVLVGLGTIVTLFAVFGIDVLTLLTSLSIVAAAVAIITKDYISDFIVGLYFSFSGDFEINDFVQLGEQKGKIIELQLLKTKILNDDDDVVIIPNSKVYNNDIINYTKRDIRSMSIDFQIDIKAVKNIESLEEELKDALVDFEEFIEANSFNMRIVNMRKDYIDLKFQYTLKKVDRELQRQIRKNTVRQVFNFISEKSVI